MAFRTNAGRGSNGHGVALFSGSGSVTTPANQPPATPTISAGVPTSSGATLTGSAFSDPDVGDTHAASQWQVTTAADTGFASPLYNPGDDATNKTSLVWSGGSASTGYLARVRYKDNHGNYSLWATSASFTTAAGASNQAIQFAATTGVGRTAASVADLVSATGLTFRFRVKGAALIPGASTNRALLDISDASGAGQTGLKIALELSQNAAGSVAAYTIIGGVGLNGMATYNTSVITDATAWYQVLWGWNTSGTTDKRQIIVWKEGTAVPVIDYHSAVATAALPTTAGQGILSIGKTISNIYGANQTDWDVLAIYSGSPYTAIGSGATVPADPTTGDTGILHLYTFPEGSGTTTADAVSGGPSLALTNATWEAGL